VRPDGCTVITRIFLSIRSIAPPLGICGARIDRVDCVMAVFLQFISDIDDIGNFRYIPSPVK
jgi:hypothetical protein